MTIHSATACLIAGVQSRTGKTTMTLALLAALKRAGIPVAPFKAGPDFIDSAWHEQVCGLPSYNLDTVLVGSKASRQLLARQGQGALAVVEGVMGLYDGREGVGGPGSSADLAHSLDLPVLLVVDVQGLEGSLVPLVDGFVRAARGFSIVGVLANRVGRSAHADRLARLLDEYHLPPLLGWLPRDAALTLPARHLGLAMPLTSALPNFDRFATSLHLDLDRLLQVLAAGPKPAVVTEPPPPPPLLLGKTIAVARDAAFSFLYPANLDWLARMGAKVKLFSPLAGDSLPKQTDAVWLPGGYPELFAHQLSASTTWSGLRTLAASGGSILAECGGMMALGATLVDHAGATWPMAGVLPIHTRMTTRLVALGYRQEEKGARGHEFHYSERLPADELPPAFVVSRGDRGVRMRSVLASYIHWYFPSAPAQVAAWFGG